MSGEERFRVGMRKTKESPLWVLEGMNMGNCKIFKESVVEYHVFLFLESSSFPHRDKNDTPHAQYVQSQSVARILPALQPPANV